MKQIRSEKKTSFVKRALIACALIFIVGTLPYLFTGSSIIDALFESVSGFTGTGATVFAKPEDMPGWLLIYRSLTQWIGGLLVILFFFPLLPRFKHNESCRDECFVYIYALLTAVEFLVLLVQIPAKDALCLALSSVSTGGFMTNAAGLGIYPASVQVTLSVFMFLTGIGFGIYYLSAQKDFEQLKKNTELKLYIIITAFSAIILLPFLGRESGFSAISFLTSTGFFADNLRHNAPGFAVVWLLILSFIGPAALSVGGGIGLTRFAVLGKLLGRSFVIKLHPSAVKVIKLDKKPQPSAMINSMLSYVLLYTALIMAGSFLISFGCDSMDAAITSSLGLVNNLGLYSSAECIKNCFCDFNVFTKAVMCLLMIAGRLNIYALFFIGKKK